jgi:hypothetical protein
MLTIEQLSLLSEDDQNEYLTLCELELDRSARGPLLERAARDIVWWVNEYCWTYDPRLSGEKFIPFKLFPKQAEYLLWLEERERTKTSGAVEKGRDMGMSWLCMAFLVHRWLFTPGFAGSMGSRKEELVDSRGDPKTLFEKMRMILLRLPDWMMPVGFDRKIHDNFRKLINPANGATISGEAGANMGHGGRSSVYFVDEAAYVDPGDNIEAALPDNSNVVIYVGTHHGPSTSFNRMIESKEFSVFRMTWLDDPRKRHWELQDTDGNVIENGPPNTEPNVVPAGYKIVYPWRVAKEIELRHDPVRIAEQIDADPSGSVDDIAIPREWVKSAVDLYKRVDMPGEEWIEAGFDIAAGGANSSVVAIRCGPVVSHIFERSAPNTTDTANWALDICEQYGVGALNYDAPGVGTGVVATFEILEREKPLRCGVYPINTGLPASTSYWIDGYTANEKFRNYKAELWHIVRDRFQKTWENKFQGSNWPLDECISIPDDPQLIRELSNIKRERLPNGKWQMETKAQLKQRGVPSPDYADALVLAFCGNGGPMNILTSDRKREMR